MGVCLSHTTAARRQVDSWTGLALILLLSGQVFQAGRPHGVQAHLLPLVQAPCNPEWAQATERNLQEHSQGQLPGSLSSPA